MLRGRCALLVTCEHASAAVPKRYRHLFDSETDVLRTHRALDLGALPVAQAMAEHFLAPLLAGHVTRLLVDLNRGPRHPQVFSEFTQALSKAERRALLSTYHTLHEGAVHTTIENLLATHPCVVHIAVHSFTPVLGGQKREADLGLLYDPQRPRERRLCHDWQAALRDSPVFTLPVRRNYPYRGVADGLPTRLRRRFPDRCYAGVELEVNQRLLDHARDRSRVAKTLAASLDTALAQQNA